MNMNLDRNAFRFQFDSNVLVSSFTCKTNMHFLRIHIEISNKN